MVAVPPPLRIQECDGVQDAVDGAGFEGRPGEPGSGARGDSLLSKPALWICRSLARRSRYAYVVLGVATLGILGSSVGHSFAVAPYNGSVMGELGLSRTELSSMWAATMLLSAGWSSVVGFAVDRFGAQTVVLMGGSVLLAGFALFSSAEGQATILLGLAIVRLSSVETVDFACRHCLNQWFVQRRGAAAGMLNAMSSIGYLLPACETLSVIGRGWRSAAWRFGGCSAMLIVGSAFFLLSSPEEHGMAPDGECPARGPQPLAEPVGRRDVAFREAVRSPMLWAIIFCWVVMCIPWAGINFLLASILKGQHYSQEHAVFVYVMLALCSAASAFATGFVVDCIPQGMKQLSVALVNGSMLLALLAGACLSFAPGPLGPMLLGAFLGCWEGTGNVVSTVIIAEVFGRKEVGAIRGVFMASTQVSSGIGPLVTAVAMDAGMGFSAICLTLAACQVAGIALLRAAPLPMHKGGADIELSSAQSLR